MGEARADRDGGGGNMGLRLRTAAHRPWERLWSENGQGLGVMGATSLKSS